MRYGRVDNSEPDRGLWGGDEAGVEPVAQTKKKQTPEEIRRGAFGEAVAEAMHMRQITQVEVGELLGVTQSSVSAWRSGQAAPDPDTVFDLERTLRLGPGHLSRHLGYLPLEAGKRAAVTVQDAVLADALLAEQAKRAVLAVYEELKNRGGTRRGRPSSRTR